MPASKKSGLVSDLSPLSPRVILDKFLNFLVPQFPHLHNGNSSPRLVRFVRILSSHVQVTGEAPGTGKLGQEQHLLL